MTLENWETVALQWDTRSGQVRALDARGTAESARIIAALTSSPYGHSISLVPDADAAIDLGSATNRFRDIYASRSVSIGTTPATVGAIRLQNATYIRSRNFGNTLDHVLIGEDATDTVVIAGNSQPVNISGSLSFGTTPATIGTVRLPNNSAVYARNAGNTTDIDLIYLSNGDIVGIGTGAAGVQIGSSPATAGIIRIPNNALVQARNVANTNNVPLITLDGSDNVIVGGAGGATPGVLALRMPNAVNSGIYFQTSGASTVAVMDMSGNLALGGNPASAGRIRIPVTDGLFSRNNANTGNVELIRASSGDVVTLDNAGTAGTQTGGTLTVLGASISVGATPSTAGAIRIPNNTYLTSRNAANSANINLARLGADDIEYLYNDSVKISGSGDMVLLGSAFSVGGTPASTGIVRLPSQTAIRWRNAANTGNVADIQTDATDRLILGDSVNPIYLQAGAGTVDFRYAVTALGGGAAPTFGTIGGAGPAVAAQNSWLRIAINGTASYIPIWR